MFYLSFPAVRCDAMYEEIFLLLSDTDDCTGQCTGAGDASCTDLVDGFECICLDGYTFDGTNCVDSTNDCPTTNVCSGQGTCTDAVSDYSCACNAGFEGKDCQFNIDECSGVECNNGNCVDGINSFTCNCLTGFENDGLGGFCNISKLPVTCRLCFI